MKKSLVRTRCVELWRDEFVNAAEKKGSPSHVPWWMGVQISPCLLKALFRLQSGHISINGLYYLMGKTGSPNCSECYRIEEAHHLLEECARNEPERVQIIKRFNLKRQDDGGPMEASHLCKLIYYKAVKA